MSASWRTLVGVVTVVLVVAALIVFTSTDGPEDVVEDYFDAILDRDVDRALTYVGPTGSRIPYGETATYLHPDAIADGWEVLDVKESTDRQPSRTARIVDVTIGNADTKLTGPVKVYRHFDEWRLSAPFVYVTLDALSFTYAQINNRIVATDENDLFDRSAGRLRTYRLFPGLYTFLPSIAGTTNAVNTPQLLLPMPAREDPIALVPPALTFTEATNTATQQAVNTLLDGCVAYATMHPDSCPFRADRSIRSDDQSAHHVGSIHDIAWAVEEYPVVRVEDSGSGDPEDPGLRVTFDKPGFVRLSATGRDENRRTVDFTAACEIHPDLLRVRLQLDGTPLIGLTGDPSRANPDLSCTLRA